MSEARNQRFEIDIDEIERQLRRSVEAPAEPKADPLAELARIVGQNDPFQGILSNPAARTAPRIDAANANYQSVPGNGQPELAYAQPAQVQHAAAEYDYAPQAAHPPALHADDQLDRYDPVADVYGSREQAFTDEQEQKPLRRRPARGKLIMIAAALVVTAGAVTAGLSMRKSGGFLASGTPPVISADTSPLKVAPENPGGVEVPNQDRQIYARGKQDGQSRVVDGREQPIDVRAATPPVSARAPVAERSPVAEALGEPRRVRTVAVNPDGTAYGAAAASTPGAHSQDLIPTGELPAPVPVQTVAVPTQPVAAPAPVLPAPTPVAAAPSTHQPVSVLPPARPNFGAKPAVEPPTRTASVNPAAPAPTTAKPKPTEATKPKPTATAAHTDKPAEKPAAAAPGAKNFTVQIAVRPSEQEARQAWDQAQEKFGSSLESRPARLTSAKVAGKTVHRVRLGPMTKAEADKMCGNLKAKGGACFVAQN